MPLPTRIRTPPLHELVCTEKEREELKQMAREMVARRALRDLHEAHSRADRIKLSEGKMFEKAQRVKEKDNGAGTENSGVNESGVGDEAVDGKSQNVNGNEELQKQ